MTVEILKLRNIQRRIAAQLSTMTIEEISASEFQQELVKMGQKVLEYERGREQEIRRQRQKYKEQKYIIIYEIWANSQTKTHRTCFHCGKPRGKGRWFCSISCYHQCNSGNQQ